MVERIGSNARRSKVELGLFDVISWNSPQNSYSLASHNNGTLGLQILELPSFLCLLFVTDGEESDRLYQRTK